MISCYLYHCLEVTICSVQLVISLREFLSTLLSILLISVGSNCVIPYSESNSVSNYSVFRPSTQLYCFTHEGRLREAAIGRKDEQLQLLLGTDCVAAEVKYHEPCHTSYLNEYVAIKRLAQ